MLHRAVGDDLDQLGIEQHFAVHEDRVRDLDLIVGQGDDQLVRRVVAVRQPFGQPLADGHLDVVDQLPQDVGHQRPFAVGQALAAAEEQIADGLDQIRPAGRGLVPRHAEQLVDVDTLSEIHRGGVPENCLRPVPKRRHSSPPLDSRGCRLPKR